METTILTLPTTGANQTNFTTSPTLFAEESEQRLPRLEKVFSSGQLLRKSALVGNDEVKSLTLTLGCAHRCRYCPARTRSGYPGDGVVRLVGDAAERLDRELSKSVSKPKAVQISPHSDPFPPLLEVQMETARVVEVLARHGVQSWLMTRGYVRPAIAEILADHADFVKLRVGLTTTNRTWQRMLEPLTAPPQLRWKMIARLRSLGLPVQIALEPLMPGLTDSKENLTNVLEMLADLHIARISAGYLYLPMGSEEEIQQTLQPRGLDALVLDEYAGGPLIRMAGQGVCRFLSKSRRQRGYATLMTLAANYGISVTISTLSNPDFSRVFQPPAESRRLAGTLAKK